jgi:hypothetical protein
MKITTKSLTLMDFFVHWEAMTELLEETRRLKDPPAIRNTQTDFHC